jgi:integrase
MKTSAGHLTREQILAVLKAARAESERDFLMILTAYSHGMRAQEVCNLRTTDVDGGYISIERLKGSRTTVQPLVEDDSPLLDEKSALIVWIPNVLKGSRLFPITRHHFLRQFKKYARLAGVPPPLLRVHNLKHSTAMSLVDAVPLHELQIYMGHANLNSTAQYVKPNAQQVFSSVATARKAMAAGL